MNNINELKDMVLASAGKFFVVEFVKKDKSLRRMCCRLGVKKGLTGTGRTWEKDNLITVYDMEAHQYRNVNLKTLKSFRCGKVDWTDKQGEQ